MSLKHRTARRETPRGIKATLIRKLRATTVPSQKGECEVCNRDGRVRYFVAAKLPRVLYLCDDDYLRIRDRLELALLEILEDEELG